MLPITPNSCGFNLGGSAAQGKALAYAERRALEWLGRHFERDPRLMHIFTDPELNSRAPLVKFAAWALEQRLPRAIPPRTHAKGRN